MYNKKKTFFLLFLLFFITSCDLDGNIELEGKIDKDDINIISKIGEQSIDKVLNAKAETTAEINVKATDLGAKAIADAKATADAKAAANAKAIADAKAVADAKAIADAKAVADAKAAAAAKVNTKTSAS